MCGYQEPATNKKNQKILIISFVIITLFMLIEVISGIITNSLALLSDAGHMLSDSVSMLIAIIAFSIAAKKSNSLKTYGYKRFEVLAALFNGISLITISIFIVIEAIERFQSPGEILSYGMLIVSILGLIVNIVIMILMMKKADVENNINMRGAYLHVIGDALGSVGAIIASIFIILFDWQIADPIMSIIIAIIISKSGIGLIKDSLYILMENKPKHIKEKDIKNVFLNHKEVKGIYDLHVWTITSNVHVLTVKLQINVLEEKVYMKLIHDIEHELEHLGISHSTIQIDYNLNEKPLYCNLKIIESNDGHHHHHH